MTSLIIACFEKEEEAIMISRKFSQLEGEGELTIFERVIVRKNNDGSASVLQADVTDGLRSLSGLAVDTLVSVLGGPVGMVLGILSGTFAGKSRDVNYFGFPDDLDKKITSRMLPGEVCIVAEIDDNNSSYLNTILGVRNIRSNVDYEYINYTESQIETIDEEIEMKRIRMKSATTNEKSILLQRIADLKEKRRRKLAELDRKTRELSAKLSSAAFLNHIETKPSHHEAKIARLKSRIEKHQMILAELRNELKHLEGVNSK